MLSELWKLLLQGGFVMPPLVVGAIILWYALGYRFFTLVFIDRRDARTLVRAAEAGHLGRPRGVLATAAVRGVALARAQVDNLHRTLDEAFYPLDQELGRFSRVAGAVVRAAPLAGLLGTVSGMIDTFDALAETSALVNTSSGVAGGISEALFSTQLGLMVAIPGLIIGRLLDRRQTLLSQELTKMKDILSAEAMT